ncbi:sperm acrosome membrane-associated protein 6 isoform X1 [Alosa sapidissima]|uniref:sperm acrosome membrane-associated protein 6 isoform X1 n=3 Tax=Alosa sapidissima TaxID=34773 RepID=UPI001C09F450|nr:sperm acrosome membrane-associated protein 6 isoform X1 [Alosa sapidissima]
MLKLIFCLLCLSLCVDRSLTCLQCFISSYDSVRLCWGHILIKENIRNVDACMVLLDNIFNFNQTVINAGRVGRGYDQTLTDIMVAQIMPLLEEFDQKTHSETVYKVRLMAAAENFTAHASKVPRASGCFPPCGFQVEGSVYNCRSCQYDSCEYPLDCPVKEVVVGENNRTQMRCDVLFPLPGDIEVVWRYAETETQLLELLKEVTMGADLLYSIPSASPQHAGTYQCEIFTEGRSIVRQYFYLTVIPQTVIGHSELQSLFDQTLVSGGQSPQVTPDLWEGSLLRLPPPSLLTVCLSGLLLLLLFSLGSLFWWSFQRDPIQSKDSRGMQGEKYVFL